MSFVSAVADSLLHAGRSLRRAPGVGAALVVTIAFAAGGNLAIGSVLDRMLFRNPSRVARPGELRRLYVGRHAWNGAPYVTEDFSYPDYRDFGRATSGYATLVAYAHTDRLLAETGQWTGVAFAPADLFSVLGIQPMRGRFFSDEEASPSSPSDVAVMSFQLWSTSFGADTSIIGRRLNIDGHPLRVIGIAPRGFQGLDLQPTDIWLPLGGLTPSGETARWQNRDAQFLQIIVRLASDSRALSASVDQRLTAVLRSAHVSDVPADPRATVLSGPLARARGPGTLLTLDARSLSLVGRLTVISLLVLLVSIGNCASILFLRAVRRRREIEIRLALGLTRWRLLAELAFELGMVAAAAAAAAVLIGSSASRVLQVMLLPSTRGLPLGLDNRALAATALLALLAALVAGIGPTLFVSRVAPGDALRVRDSFRLRSGARTLAIVGQTALSVVLVSVAATFVVSARRATVTRLGFDSDHLITIVIGPADSRAVAHSLESVRSLSFASAIANSTSELAPGSAITRVAPSASAGDSSVMVSYNAVDTGYFGTLGVRLLRGRTFTSQDGASSEPVAMVTQATAALLWKNTDAIGRCVRAFGACRRVVGVARDVRWDLTRAAVPHFYMPLAQSPLRFGRVIYVQTAAPATLANVVAVKRALAQSDSAGAPPRLYRVQDRLELQLRPLRGASGLLLGYALLILCSACAGMYGKLSFDASLRMRELGVRAALGATRGDQMIILIGSGMRLLGIGLITGVAGAFTAGKFIQQFVFDISGSDPAIVGVIATLLFLTGLSAMLFASWRATAIDPAVALRSE